MFAEFWAILFDWGAIDTWIVLTAALASMACALPGNFLVLRRQSMMGDAISHTVLPGIVIAFLLTHHLLQSGVIDDSSRGTTMHLAMFIGAIIFGILTALLTEWVQKLGRVESTAALGVVFLSLYAVGLLLIRRAADNVHIDPDCVLYGMVETAWMDTIGESSVPRMAVVNGSVLLVNAILVVLFYKELKISAFDPGLATTVGVNASAMHYGLMCVTAITLVASFESVGNILVIAMLIVPAATAYLLSDRLSHMIVISLVVAAASALFGHVAAMTLPPIFFRRIGFTTVTSASTPGMMAAVAGLFFIAALLAGPRHGLLSKLLQRFSLRLRIVREDVLGFLYRREESQQSGNEPVVISRKRISESLHHAGWILSTLAIRQLLQRERILMTPEGYRLTESGRRTAQKLVRSHRLWESYMARHFDLPEDHLHETAARVEHFIDVDLRETLASELEGLEIDPHGREIPPAVDEPTAD